MIERQISPEKLREFRLNDFVKIVIRGARGLKEKCDVSGTNTVSVAEFNYTQERVKREIEKAMEEGFALREIIEKLKPALDSSEYRLELYGDQLNLTTLLRSCATLPENNEEGQIEKINEVVIKDIKSQIPSAEPLVINFSLVPPDNRPGPKKSNSSPHWVEFVREKKDRKAELISVLQNDCHLVGNIDYYHIACDPAVAEEAASKRFRKEEYDAYVIPSSKLMFLVCDEGGNSSFIIKRPFIGREELQKYLELCTKNGVSPLSNIPESDHGDNPIFYAPLTKSRLDLLSHANDNGLPIVDVIDWNSTEWVDRVLNSVTNPGLGSGNELPFAKIKELLATEKPRDIVGKIKEYVRGLTDDELRTLTAKQIHEKLLQGGIITLPELEILGENPVTRQLASIREERNISIREVAPADVLEKVNLFIEQAVNNVETMQLDSRALYNKMLASGIGVSETDYKYKSFETRLHRRKLLIPEYKKAVETRRKRLEIVDKFFGQYSTADLVATQPKELHDKYLAYLKFDGREAYGIVSRKAIDKHWTGLLKRKSEDKQKLVTWRKVEAFLEKEKSTNLIGKNEMRALYDKFLAENSIDKVDYSFEAFDTKYRRWKKDGFMHN